MGIITDVLEICADDAETLILTEFPEAMNPLYGVLLIQITSQAIDGIGGIGNNPSLLESVHNLADKPQLRIFRIDFDDHQFYPPRLGEHCNADSPHFADGLAPRQYRYNYMDTPCNGQGSSSVERPSIKVAAVIEQRTMPATISITIK